MEETLDNWAKHAMKVANREAARREMEAVDSRSILIGILRQRGVAWNAIANHNAPPRRIRRELAKTMPPVVTRRRRDVPLSEEAARILQQGRAGGDELGLVDYFGSEHLLLGILRAPDCDAARHLDAFDIRLDAMQREIVEFLGGDFDEE